jgi:hypothetical protein
VTAPRIRWSETPNGGFLGYVCAVGPWLFQIWKPRLADRWELMAQLPGWVGQHQYGPTSDDLKAEAEQRLEEFVSSLGAVFPDPAPQHVHPPTMRCNVMCAAHPNTVKRG